LEAVRSNLVGAHIFISAAAVSDYRAHQVADEKIKKTSDTMSLSLARAPDVLATISRSESPPFLVGFAAENEHVEPNAPRTPAFLVGFAAETEHVERNALAKLTGKKLDMIAANKVGAGLAFDKDENALTVYWPGGGKRELAFTSKLALARQLVEVIAE